MARKRLTRNALIVSARAFCAQTQQHPELFGVTDGKAVGTFVEHQFQEMLQAEFVVRVGNSAVGIDLPTVGTDIKVTSLRQPQSSCPFQSARQKVYGLGYHLLFFVYDKQDDPTARHAVLRFASCAFIHAKRTADYQTTRGLRDILRRNGNHDDVVAFLMDHRLPGDEIVHNTLADEIMQSPPALGYLTI